MPRYIDANKLRRDVFDLPNCYNGFSDTYDKAMIIDLIDEQPTVDAEPVKQERCEFCKDGKTFLGAVLVLGNDGNWHSIRYCPNCGAKMDEEEK